MTCFFLIRIATATVLIGSLSACVVPFVMVLPSAPTETVSVQSVTEAGPTVAETIVQDRRDRRDERNAPDVSGASEDKSVDRPPRFNVRPARNNDAEKDDADRDGGQVQGDQPTRSVQSDAEDDKFRDGGQTFSVDLGL